MAGGSRSRVTVRDNRLRTFMARLKTMRGIKVTVGVQGKEAEETHPESKGVPMRVIAAAHELGLGTVPKRSFLRETYDMHRDRYAEFVVSGARQTAAGFTTILAVMWQAGEMIRGDIIQRMRSGIPPPLKDPSEERGGESAIPLIDKGHLIGSISSVVHVGGRRLI